MKLITIKGRLKKGSVIKKELCPLKISIIANKNVIAVNIIPPAVGVLYKWELLWLGISIKTFLKYGINNLYRINEIINVLIKTNIWL